jgi:hypothetical protein
MERLWGILGIIPINQIRSAALRFDGNMLWTVDCATK